MSTLKKASNKFKNFGRSLVGNRIFDLYLKYNGIKLLTTATLVPIALIMGRDAFVNVVNKSSQDGGAINNVPVIDDPLVGTYLKLAGISSLGSITPSTLVPLGVLMLLYNIYNSGNFSGKQQGGGELMNYVKKVWGNRVLDLFFKYKGLKLLTTTTLVPIALLFSKDMLENVLKGDQSGGAPIPDDLPFFDDPLIGNYLKLAGLSSINLNPSTLIPLGLLTLLYNVYFED